MPRCPNALIHLASDPRKSVCAFISECVCVCVCARILGVCIHPVWCGFDECEHVTLPIDWHKRSQKNGLRAIRRRPSKYTQMITNYSVQTVLFECERVAMLNLNGTISFELIHPQAEIYTNVCDLQPKSTTAPW